MSDNGYGWWQASDGSWYLPEQHPSYSPTDPQSYGWWQASDGVRYPPNQHPQYRPPAPGGSSPLNQGGPPPPSPSAFAGGYVSGEPVVADLGMTPFAVGIIVAAAFIALGSMLPWAKINLGIVGFSTGGLDGDGRITLFLALVVGVVGGLSQGHKMGLGIGALIAAALTALIAVIDVADVGSTAGDFGLGGGEGISVGYGLWIVLLASLAACGLAVKIIIDSRSQR